MFYDTLYRHNQALAPTGLESVPSALHALNAAVDDCRRAGKSIAADASILLLIRSLADAAERAAPSVSELRRRCQLDRSTVEASPALLAIAGNSVGGDYPAKTTFHYQARRALAQLARRSGSIQTMCASTPPWAATMTTAPPSCATRTCRSASFRAASFPTARSPSTAAGAANTLDPSSAHRLPSY